MKTKFNEVASSEFVKAICAMLVAVALLPVVCLGEQVNLYDLRLKDGIYYNQEVPYSGEYRTEDEMDGVYSSIGNMKNGKMHGEFKRFTNQALTTVGNYKDGKPHGEWKNFNYDGKLESVKNYKDGKRHGEWKYFDKDGKLREIRNYINGNLQGMGKSFDKNGNLMKAQPNAISTFVDSRDGKEYKYVKIGTQIWMAENLNYEVKGGSWCYDNKTENCTKYGRLYDGKAAMESCPNGWHLPNEDEWIELINFVSGVYEVAGTKLKSKNGWNNYSVIGVGTVGNGTDDFGFSALPGGYGHRGGHYYSIGDEGHWWYSPCGEISNYYISAINDGIYHQKYGDPPDKHGVRCLKD